MNVPRDAMASPPREALRNERRFWDVAPKNGVGGAHA